MSGVFRVVMDLAGGASENGNGESGVYTLMGVFPDEASRDEFFKGTPANRKSLRNGSTIVTGQQLQQWTGANSPRTYDPKEWVNASVALRGDAHAILPANVKPGSILTVDQTGKRLVETGASVTPDGSVMAGSPNSFYLAESHRISSAGSHIQVTNLATDECFFPVFVPDVISGQASARFPYFLTLDPSQKVFGSNTGDVTNPTTSYVPARNQRFYSFELLPSRDMTNVRMEMSVNNHVAWDIAIGDFKAQQTAVVDLHAACEVVDLHANQAYTMRIYSKDGDVVVRGDPVTGQPWLTGLSKEYIWQRVETENTRLQAITAGADQMATFDFADGRQLRLDARAWFAKPAVDGITSEVDIARKAVTLKLTSGGNVIATGTIDLSQLYSGGTVQPTPVNTPVNVYYGFIDTRRADRAVAKAGSVLSVRNLRDLRITYQRAGSENEYLFFWAPDSLGEIKGFAFDDTLADQWAYIAVDIDGVAGKMYVSDNPTTAKVINLEVKA